MRWQPGQICSGTQVCGCGVGDIDTDRDGVPDCADHAPQAPLTVTGPDSGTYGDLLAITTSGGNGTGALSFNVGTSTACAINAGQLAITSGTGSCTVTATKVADILYASTTSAPHAVTVHQAPQTPLTLHAPASLTYGTTAPLTASGGSSIGAVTFSAETSTGCTVSGDQLAVTNASGICVVTATREGDDNYTLATAAQVVTLSKAVQAPLTLNAGSSLLYNATETLSTTGGSGTGEVTYNVMAGSCAVSSDQLTATSGTGTCAVTATKAADTNYNQATSAPMTVPLNKANATITVTPYSVTYDGTAHTATGSARGVQNESLSGLDLRGTTHTNAGDYPSEPWTFTDSTGNYNNAGGTIHSSIARAVLTITAVTNTKPYDGNISAAAIPTVSGLQGSDTVTGLTETYDTKSAGTGKPLAVASYTVNDGNSGNNYTVTTAPNTTGVINPVALTITARDASKTYGQTVTFAGTEFTTSGLLNGDTVTSVTLTSSGAAATAAVAGSPYTIVPSAAVGIGLGNYTISYVNGTLTVTPASTSIAVSASLNPSLFGQAVTCTATVSTGAGTPTGNVQFFDGTTLLGTQPVAGSTATLTTSTLGLGLHTLTAKYLGDSNFNSSTSAPLAQQVHYGFVGLLAPYVPPPTAFKIKSTIPLKWQYTNATGSVVNSASANPQVAIVYSGSACSSTVDQVVTINDAGTSGYQYDTTANTWQFNWKTTGLSAGCYVIHITSNQTGQTNGDSLLIQLQ